MILINAFPLDDCFSATKSFILAHKFSMAFKSGLLPGQSSAVTWFSFRNFFTILDQCHGAPSCIKIVVLWTAICDKSLFFSNSTYLAPFMAVPDVKKYNSAVPFLLMASHIIWLGGVFHGRNSVFLIKCLSNWSANMLMSDNKLLESGLIAEQDFAPVISSPVKMLSGELQPLLLRYGCQLWIFCRLAKF